MFLGKQTNFILFFSFVFLGANNSYVYEVIMKKYWPSIWVPILLVVLINQGWNHILFYFILFYLLQGTNLVGPP
jgi:hypothetical protein